MTFSSLLIIGLGLLLFLVLFVCVHNSSESTRGMITEVMSYASGNIGVYSKGDVCSICLNAFPDEPSAEQKKKNRNLKCNHSFHTECISEWFKTSNVCPMCRDVQSPVEMSAVSSSV